jgi:hypothetical protein
MPGKTIGSMTYEEHLERLRPDLRKEIRDTTAPMFDAMNSRFNQLEQRVTSESHRTHVMIEQLINKVDLTLDQSHRVAIHDQTLPAHEIRIERLETDVKVIKLALGKKKS